MTTPSDHQSVHSPATTVLTFSATSCCSPFTVTSAPSAASSAPSSPVADKSHHHHHQHDRPSIDNVAVSAIVIDDDAWQHITDPKERRRVQNRIAQRKYREKEAVKREQSRRETRNQRLAGGSYARPWVRDTQPLLPDNNNSGQGHASNPFFDSRTSARGTFIRDNEPEEFNGVPWGGLNFEQMAHRSQGEYHNKHREMMLRWEQRQRMLAQRDWMQRQRYIKAQGREQQQQRFHELQNTVPAATLVPGTYFVPPLVTVMNDTDNTNIYGGAFSENMISSQRQLPQETIPTQLSMHAFGTSMFVDSNIPLHPDATPMDPALLVSMCGYRSVDPSAMGMELDQASQVNGQAPGGGGSSAEEGEVMSPTFPIEDEMEIGLLAWPD